MPALLALPAFWGAVAAGGSAAAGIYGANKQAGAAEDAAQLQTQAANHGADVQKQSADAALAFQKQQSAQDLANAQAASRGNYDQWAAKQGRLSTLGQMVGLKPFQIPNYVPIQSVPSPQAPPPSNGAPQGYTNPNVTSMAQAFRARV